MEDTSVQDITDETAVGTKTEHRLTTPSHDLASDSTPGAQIVAEPVVTPPGEASITTGCSADTIAGDNIPVTAAPAEVEWDHEPFVPTGRPYHWKVHPHGELYLASRLPEYDQIEGPQGVAHEEYEKRLQEKRLAWKRAVSKAYMSHWPDFDYSSLLRPSPSKQDLRTAKNRVITKITNMLATENERDIQPDVISMLFRTGRGASGKDVWARNDPAYKALEEAAMIAKGWTPAMPRSEAFPMQMRIRAKLFDELDDVDKVAWQDKAKQLKQTETTLEEMLSGLTKVFGLFGDAIAQHTGWYLEIRAGGKSKDGTAQYYMEKFKPVSGDKILDFGELPSSETYDLQFREAVANAHEVDLNHIEQLQSWKPKIGGAGRHVPEVTTPAVLLGTSLEFNEKGEITSTESQVRSALVRYMETTYALVPGNRGHRRRRPKKPDWPLMRRAKTTEEKAIWVSPDSLPPGFNFDDPLGLCDEPLFELATWIINGEQGKLEDKRRFRWVGQQDSLLEEAKTTQKGRSARSKKAVTPGDRHGECNVIGGETIDLEGVDGSNEQEITAKRKNKCESKDVGADERPTKRQRVQKVKVLGNIGQSEVTPPESSDPHQPSPPQNRPIRRKSAKMIDSSDEDDGEEQMKSVIDNVGIVARRMFPEPHEGDIRKWNDDWESRIAGLDWGLSGVGEMGCNILDSAKFLEATEVMQLVELGGLVDLTAPSDELGDISSHLLEEIFDLPKPLPVLSQYRSLKDWLGFMRILLQRVRIVFDAILQYPTDHHWTRLRVGGHLGLFPALRALEFARRWMAAHGTAGDDMAMLDRMLDDMQEMVAQEQWRRWSINTLARYEHRRAGDLAVTWMIWLEMVLRCQLPAKSFFDLKWRSAYMMAVVEELGREAAKRRRGCTYEDLFFGAKPARWREEDVRKGMSEWFMEMSEDYFLRGSVVEKFTLVCSVYMVAGPGKQHTEDWCFKAVESLQLWLENDIKKVEPSLLAERGTCLTKPRAPPATLTRAYTTSPIPAVPAPSPPKEDSLDNIGVALPSLTSHACTGSTDAIVASALVPADLLAQPSATLNVLAGGTRDDWASTLVQTEPVIMAERRRIKPPSIIGQDKPPEEVNQQPISVGKRVTTRKPRSTTNSKPVSTGVKRGADRVGRMTRAAVKRSKQ